MGLVKYFLSLFEKLNNVEENIVSTKLSTLEIKEIMQNALEENIPFFKNLIKITKLGSFDLGFLMSSVSLNKERVEIIKKAIDLYDEEEFMAQGQTLSDFVFRVASNINILTETNLEWFKELVKCKNEIYDFASALHKKTPLKRAVKKTPVFEFQKIIY